MALTKKMIMAKARGFTISIEKMGEKDRVQTPTGAFADDYNRLLSATTQLLPQLTPLLPPIVQTYQGGNGSMFADSSYREIDAFCEQIYQLASECEDPA